MKRELKYETRPGGKYQSLEEYEVDDAIREIAKRPEMDKNIFITQNLRKSSSIN